ncbi:MAG: hypothetical protein ACKV2T_38880 [Kofleriaceae bacterium]
MGGCTNCKGKGACDDHKSTMMGSVEAAIEALYPSRVWGEIDDAQTSSDPFTPDDLAGLADELATDLRAATFVRQGGDDEACDYIYVLCMGRAPCVVQVRDHGVPIPDEWRGTNAIEELYLRVVIAQRTRHVAVQQVAVQLVRVDEDGDAREVAKGDDVVDPGFVIHERPRAGVYDAPLLARMQKLVAILPAYDLVHVDFGDIAHAPPGFAPGTWSETYGLGSAKPSIANYLFYPQPTTMVTTTFLAAAPHLDSSTSVAHGGLVS